MGSKIKSGVVVITLTATVYEGKYRKMYSSRIGFAGTYSKETLPKMSKEFKKLYVRQHEKEYEASPIKPDKIVYRVSTKTTECELILNGK